MAGWAGGMGGMVGRFLEAAGNVIWDRHKVSLSPSSNAATDHIAHPVQVLFDT